MQEKCNFQIFPNYILYEVHTFSVSLFCLWWRLKKHSSHRFRLLSSSCLWIMYRFQAISDCLYLWLIFYNELNRSEFFFFFQSSFYLCTSKKAIFHIFYENYSPLFAIWSRSRRVMIFCLCLFFLRLMCTRVIQFRSIKITAVITIHLIISVRVENARIIDRRYNVVAEGYFLKKKKEEKRIEKADIYSERDVISFFRCAIRGYH